MASEHTAPGTRLIDRSDGVRSLVFKRALLRVESGLDAGKEFAVDRPSVRVGTDGDCDLVLSDETVSSVHFELSATPEGVLLRDHLSKNGTLVDGNRARELYLNRSATLQVGNTTVRYAVLDDEVEIEISRATNFGDLLGHSPAMRAAFSLLEQAAQTDATVLILGESGTGKELAARAVAQRSARRDGPYQVFDCGAVPANLIESALFGHARGAFTGAAEARAGVFEEADGGTLVFDEIGELPLELQPKLLRALESRTVQRVGENNDRTVDVRFIASTNRNLQEEVKAGRFRQDLYYRLAVVIARLPPLRERKEEIPRLLRHFVSQIARDDAPDVPRDIVALASAYDWPGNVRELRNFVERFVALPNVTADQLLPGAEAAAAGSATDALHEPHAALPFHEAKGRCIDHFEKNYLSRLLQEHRGNISEVARTAGISRQSCYRLMRKHGLEGDEGL